jgi:ketosteroid isomerase-like protein
MQFDPGTEKVSTKIIVEFFDRVWTPPHDLDAIDELMTEDYKITSGGKVIQGRDAFKAWVANFQRLLLEARTVSQEVFSNEQGDRLVSRWICSGKNNGIFGLPADGRFVSFTGIAIWRVRDSKLAECWIERSAFELYQSLSMNNED